MFLFYDRPNILKYFLPKFACNWKFAKFDKKWWRRLPIRNLWHLLTMLLHAPLLVDSTIIILSSLLTEWRDETGENQLMKKKKKSIKSFLCSFLFLKKITPINHKSMSMTKHTSFLHHFLHKEVEFFSSLFF